MSEAGKIGQFEIRGELGQGGVGQVFVAYDPVLDREVAIKSLRPEMLSDKSFVERFRTEARHLARLSHPNITTLYTLHEEGGNLYMIMELVRGQTVEKLLQERGAPFSVQEAVAIVAQAADGLAYAHEMGIVHRDIKPSNLILTSSGLLKIMDFGIARVQGSQRMTRDGSIVGTLAYMSPEQCRGQEVDGRTDLYSLGIVLYEMLTGSVPFSADTDYDLMQAQIGASPPSPSRLAADLPRHVEQALMKVLSKKPEARFASANEFKEAIGAPASRTEALSIVHKVTRLAMAPIAPRPATAAAESPKTLQFSVTPRSAAIAAAFVVLLAGGVGAYLWLGGPKSTKEASALPQPGTSAAAAAPGRAQNPFQVEPIRGPAKSPSDVASRAPEVKLQSAPVAPPKPAPKEQSPFSGAAEPTGTGSAAKQGPPQTGQIASADRNAVPIISENAAAVIAICDQAAASPIDKERPSNVAGVAPEKIDTKVAIAACEAATRADPSSPRLAFQLGRAYAANKQYDLARPAYEKADAANYALASTNLGTLYSEGLGVTADGPRALQLFARGANAGVAIAMLNLGSVYRAGKIVPQDLVLARRWMQRAAENGNTTAMSEYGQMLKAGTGGAQDLFEARNWLQRAAELGEVTAMSEYGQMLRGDSGGAKNPEQARVWLRRAAESGNAKAMGFYGVMLLGGEGGPRDVVEARQQFARGAEKGDALAMTGYGVLLARGEGGSKDKYEGRNWMKRGAEGGNALAMGLYGVMLWNGDGGSRDRDEARTWLEKARDNGNAGAGQFLEQQDRRRR